MKFIRKKLKPIVTYWICSKRESTKKLLRTKYFNQAKIKSTAQFQIGDMETDQNWIRSKKKSRKPLDHLEFYAFSAAFSKILKTHFMRNFPFYYSVSRIIHSITLFMGHIFFRDFSIFLIRFFLFLIRFRFPEKALNSQFVDPIFFIRSVSAYFWTASCFKKNS